MNDVEDVEKLCIRVVDNPFPNIRQVESVEKLSTVFVEKYVRTKGIELSTFTVDNSVENCAEVIGIPHDGSKGQAQGTAPTASLR